MPIQLQTKLMNDVAVIRCQGRIVLGAEADTLQAEFDQVSILRTKIVLVLADTDLLDSHGMGTLIRAMGVLRAKGGDLKLAELSPVVFKVLQITNLLTVFEVYPTAKEAVEAFAGTWRADDAGTGAATKIKILCVDTSRDVLAYLSVLLKRAGYEVFTSRYVGEALTLVSCTRPRMIIHGAGLAKLPTGAEALAKFQLSGPDVLVLALPADFSGSEAGQAGVDLVARVQTLLGGA
jgi:anti-sigma B factor antagonist